MIYRSLLIITFLYFFVACSKESNPVTTDENPVITKITMNDQWNPRSTSPYQIEVQVNDPQGSTDIYEVILHVRSDSGGSVIFTDLLYDDGAYFHTGDGDLIAGDGIFSNRFTPTQIITPVQPGIYYFSFIASDKQQHESNAVEKLVSFGENSAPYIVSIDCPDSVSAAIGEIVLQVAVSDSDGVQNIKKVSFESRKQGTASTKYEGELYDDGETEHGDTIAGDAIFSIKLGLPFIIGKQGEYDLLFYAEDFAAEMNTVIPEKKIKVINLAPLYGDLNLTEYMNAPVEAGNYNFYPITFQVIDPEGLEDIKDVYFYSKKPDGSYGNNGQPIMLRDNGLPFNFDDKTGNEVGDEIANDGIFTFVLPVASSTTQGSYTFSFYISDKAENVTGPLVRLVNITTEN